jgi:diaminopimelate epimerase
MTDRCHLPSARSPVPGSRPMLLQRYHGLGNDYLVLQAPAFPDGLDPALVRALCHRHTGLGSDGILLPVGERGLRIYNPDGSEAEKSGNGLRIFAQHRVDHCGEDRVLELVLPGETVRATVETDAVTVAMGWARVQCDVPLQLGGESLVTHLVDLGNPHCVLFCGEPLDELPWRDWGRALEVHPRFPDRTNVQVARVLGSGRVAARIWERGAGETASSGSSSCAVVAAAVRSGRLEAGRIDVVMPGGTLQVDVTADLALSLRGPVEHVATIQVNSAWLTARGH